MRRAHRPFYASLRGYLTSHADDLFHYEDGDAIMSGSRLSHCLTEEALAHPVALLHRDHHADVLSYQHRGLTVRLVAYHGFVHPRLTDELCRRHGEEP